MDDKIGLCIHELLYSSLKFHNDEVTYSLNIDNQPYKVVFLSRDQYLSSDFLIEAEFSKSSQGQCFISFEEYSNQINTIMAKKHFIANEKCWSTKYSSRDGFFGGLEKCIFDFL